MTTRLLPVLPALTLGLLLAACGGDGGNPTPTASATGPATSTGSASPGATTAAPARTATRAATGTPAATIPAPAGASTASKTTAANGGSPTSPPLLKDVRIGVHAEQGGWDRIVFEFSGGLPAARVEYVASAAQCGSGQAVAVPGTRVLTVRFQPAAAHDTAGKPTFDAQSIAGPGTTILGAKAACDFEGVVGWAVGIDSQKPFAVSTLADPPRLVIDVKQ